jgi:hypothetical protein
MGLEGKGNGGLAFSEHNGFDKDGMRRELMRRQRTCLVAIVQNINASTDDDDKLSEKAQQ